MSDLKTKVFEAIGAASMCWDQTPKGIFESTKAKEIGDSLWNAIEAENAKLRARVERLEKVREASINFLEGIKPPLGHDHHRLWLILTAAIVLTNCEASDDKIRI